MKIVPIILAGGSGKRLWPLSRKLRPKQFYSMINEEKSMLQETVLRLQGIADLTPPVIICNKHHRFLVGEQLHSLGIIDSSILVEPSGKNTAPAVSAAAYFSLRKYKDEEILLLVLPSDHVITEVEQLHEAIKHAVEQAKNNKLVTFGVMPSEAHTGYGYIKTKNIKHNKKALVIEKFVEKPNLETAKKYVQSGNYLWNSGMFVFKAKTLLKELSFHSKKIVNSTEKSIDARKTETDFVFLEEKSFMSCPNISLDIALMEKTKNAVVVPLDAGWNDLGSWNSLYSLNNKDSNQNVVKGDVLMLDTTNCYIDSSNHLVATLGVNNLIIVDTPDATLVASQDNCQDTNLIVEKLNKQNRDEENDHRKVYRPWGWYDSIESGKGFQVKVLSVNPGSILSLQKHKHRDEHWVVIKGEGRVTRGKDSFVLKSNQSTYIKKETLHRLENIGKEPLMIIEVQTGNYLGEDDIERFEDLYGRILDN